VGTQRVLLIGGVVLGVAVVLMGASVLITGETRLPIRWNYMPARGMAAYAMGLSWVLLGFGIVFGSRLLSPNIHYARGRAYRDACLVAAAALFVIAVMAHIVRAYGNGAP
jgi:hypothetical protein